MNNKTTNKNSPENKNKTPIWKSIGGNMIIWILIIIMAVSALQLFSSHNEPKKISYTDFLEYLESDKIMSAEIVGRNFNGTFRDPELIINETTNSSGEYTSFITVLPEVSVEMTKAWDDKKISYEFKDQTFGLGDYLIQFAPWLLIIFFWFFLMKKMQGAGGQGGIFNFGKSRAKIISPDKPKVSFDDVAGCDEAKVELQEIVEFLKNPKKYKKIGAKIPRGGLLLGPPGTGKTLLAKAVSGEAEVPFFSISGAEFVEMFVGVGASRVRDLFDQAKRNSPSIIFIDEIDAVGRHRGAGLGGGHDEREQTLNQILVEMDGFDTDDNVIILAATNRPDVLDKALLRPGRFDRQIIVDPPGMDGREAILKIHSRDIPFDDDVVLKTVARGTPGLVGADLENLVNEAALFAARRNKKKVTMSDFEDAKDKVMIGVERKSMILSPQEKKITAYHEGGHALVAFHTKDADPVHKVSIIPRGMTLGITAQIPIDDKHNYSKKYLLGRLDILMGGRCAEMIIFNDISTGAGNDISTATDLARKMVTEWGMSDKIGPLTFSGNKEEVFLGKDISTSQVFSEKITSNIDEEITLFVINAENNSLNLLNEKIDQLHLIAEALLEYETISGDEMDRLLKGEKIVKIDSKAKSQVKRPRRKSSSKKHTTP